MSSVETYYFAFPDERELRDEIQITHYSPHELRSPGISDSSIGHGTPSPVARDIARNAVTVLQRAGVKNVGADEMAHRLLDGNHDTYVAKLASQIGADGHMPPIGYAQTQSAGGNVLRFTALEVYDPSVGQRLLWAGGAALMACAIKYNPGASLEVYPRSLGNETRSKSFFISHLGMRMIGRRAWGEQGSKLGASSKDVMESLHRQYSFTDQEHFPL